MSNRREDLLKRIGRFRFVFGEGPRPHEMTDDELEEFVLSVEDVWEQVQARRDRNESRQGNRTADKLPDVQICDKKL